MGNKKHSMLHTQLGRVYARLAERFDISEENRKILDDMLNERDCENERLGMGLDWEIRAMKLFSDTDKRLFISAMWGIVRDEVRKKKQAILN